MDKKAEKLMIAILNALVGIQSRLSEIAAIYENRTPYKHELKDLFREARQGTRKHWELSTGLVFAVIVITIAAITAGIAVWSWPFLEFAPRVLWEAGIILVWGLFVGILLSGLELEL